MTAVLLSVEANVAHIRFNRPDQLNAINLALAEQFRDAVKTSLSNPEVRAVLISGEGRAFMAGGDLAFLRDAADRTAALTALIEPMHEALLDLSRAKLPVIAAAQGPIAGAGMSLALSVDLLILADDAKFNAAYMNIAGSPDTGFSWALPRIVGLRRAMGMTLLGDSVDAEQALALGMANRVVPAAELDAAAMTMARRLAAGPTTAFANAKALLIAGADTPLEQQLKAEHQSFVAAVQTQDFGEALDAFFEKRRPGFVGR